LDSKLYLVFALTAVIHMINTFAYAVRLAGVRTKRLALALSLFNVIFLLSSTANTIQGPLLTKYVEHQTLSLAKGTPEYNQALENISDVIRMVLLSGTVGTLIGAFLIPSYVRIFTKGILIFERVKSIPKLVRVVLSPNKLKAILKEVHLPSISSLDLPKYSGIPKRLVVLNIVITGIFTTGVLSAVYAGQFADYSNTAILLSSIINGVAMILLATIVDPTVAMVVDQTINGERSEKDVKKLVRYLAFSRVLGTLFAQVLFVPAAHIIAYIADI
jgi:hypothetical protein